MNAPHALCPRIRRRGSERGLALVCALMLMLAAMVIGVAVARGASMLRAAAHTERDRDVAQAAADAALRDAEHDIAGASGAMPERRAHFGGGDAAAFVDGCGRGADDLGLCRATSPPAWQVLDLAEADHPAVVPYGRFTGAVLAVGHSVLPAQAPAYVIERIIPAGTTAQQGSFYRITAIGFGTRRSTRVVLQSVFRLPLAAAGTGTAGGGSDHGGPGGGNGYGNEGGHGSGDGHGNEGAGHDGGNDGHGGADGRGEDGGGARDNGGGNDDGTGNDDDDDDDDGAGGGAGGGGAGGATPSPGRQLPAGRLGWREIANWTALHARARP
jgi:type IV pilus assembly protein PilX